MRKSCNYEVMKKKKFQLMLRNISDPDSDFWLDPDPDSMNRYGSETLMSYFLSSIERPVPGTYRFFLNCQNLIILIYGTYNIVLTLL